MGKDSGKSTNWESDIRKGMEDARNIKDKKKSIKEDADRRKIDGYNPGDLEHRD
jgi:hypothetical protein